MSREQRRMDRFIIIPFSSTCRSGSSVDVVDARHGKKPQGGSEGAGGGAAGKPKGESLLARLLKGFKNLSQIFAVHEEEEEEEQQEMVIGLPTDVKHVAHIGWDGSTSTTTSVRSWNRAAPADPAAAAESTSSSTAAPPPQQPQPQSPLPPVLSVRQFELAMAAQAAASTDTATATAASTSTAARHRHR